MDSILELYIISNLKDKIKFISVHVAWVKVPDI